MTSSVSENNLTKFKEYIDDKDSEINKYIGENGVVYSYDTSFGVYSYDPNKKLVNSDGSSFKTEKDNSNNTFSQMTSMSSQMTSMMGGSKNGFSELMPGKGDNLVSGAVKENYDLLYGHYPEKYNEVVLVLDTNNEIRSTDLYKLGLLPAKEYEKYMDEINKGKKVNPDTSKWSYEDACKHSFYLIPACDYYEKTNEQNSKE